MKLESIHIQNFKRFADLTIDGLQSTAKLVVLTGPNGCGKTSLFEAFNYWMKISARQDWKYDRDYYERFTEENTQDDQQSMPPAQKSWNNINPKFFGISEDIRSNQDACKKAFYIRSSYRHSPDFTTESLRRLNDPLSDSDRAPMLIFAESRVHNNYQRLACGVFDKVFDKKVDRKSSQIIEELIGEIGLAMQMIFEDLHLQSLTSPIEDGTFRFTKGDSENFHYKNLSGGEKAAFDLLLDFIIKRKVFDDTIYCIDEPELHMHSRLQAKLLEVMFNLIPDNCQLWIATHSIGMARKAAELYKENLGQVAFIDFHGQDFDQAVTLKPIQPGRKFWQGMFHTALDDLAELVAPECVVFCEGKKLWGGGRKPSFDVNVYQTIFGAEHPDVEFIPLGGASEVQNIEKAFNPLLRTLVPGIKYWKLFDRDDRHGEEIQQLQQEGAQVLQMRDLESYLWNNEIIEMLCASQGCADKLQEILEEKRLALEDNPKQGKAADDIKFISGRLYNKCKQVLGLTQCGNDAEAFALYTLAPLVTPDTKTYQELEAIVMAPIIGKAHDSH